MSEPHGHDDPTPTAGRARAARRAAPGAGAVGVAARLGAFAAATLLALGGGWAIGAAVGPIDDPDPAPRHSPAHSTPSTTVVDSGHGMSR